MKGNKDLVYHYCGIEALVSIIRTSSIWLSDYRKMNDYAEEKWIKEKVNKKIREQLISIDKKVCDIWDRYYDQNTYGTNTFFVGCFSEECDDLTQWTRYADDGRGVAIGFSKDVLCKLNDGFGLAFDKIIYDEKVQEQFVNKITKQIMDRFDRQSVMHVAIEFFQDYTLQFLKYKNPGFYSENEWRVIHYSSPAYQDTAYYGEFEFLKPEFRVNKNRIISYIPLSFSEIKQDVIKEIHLGPSSKVSINDILNLLNAYGYYENVSFSHKEPIAIIKSESTYQSY
ncbi:MAG: DUF2971 domain-containing protein [Clostridiales bacterium]|nr:DUF2971 domain-containing protein [Clostridiales bacterium]